MLLSIQLVGICRVNPKLGHKLPVDLQRQILMPDLVCYIQLVLKR